MTEKNKLLGLEVIRFLSAFFVVFAHYHFLCDIGIRHALTSQTFYPFYHSLPFLYFLSEWSVRIFWCISGFIFFWKYQAPIADRSVSFWNFFITRFARLYPLHLLTLIIIAVGQAVYVRLTGFHFLNDVNYSAPYFLAQVFMAGNRIFTGDSFNWPIWSVSIEVTVYFLFFILTRYLTKSIGLNVLIVLMCVIANVAIPQTRFLGLFECLLFFYLGGAASLLKKFSLEKKFPSHAAWIAVGLIPVVFWRTGGFLSTQSIYVFWSIWLPVLLYCASGDFKVPAWIRTIMETLGNMTYSSYLIHLPFQLIVAMICFHWKIYLPIFHPLFLTGYICLIFMLSYVVYRYFELPVKESIKAAAGCGQPNRNQRHQAVFYSAGIVIYLGLSYLPIVPSLDTIVKKLGPSQAQYMDYTKSGKSLMDAGDYAKALEVYQKAIARYPYDPDDYANLGIVYYKLGQSDQAIAHLGKALSLNPNYFMVYNNRGAIYSSMGRYDLAFENFNQALAIDPCPDSLLKQAGLLSGQTNPAAVLTDAQKAMCQDSAQVYSNMSYISSLNKNYAAAIDYLNKAIARNPQSARNYESRAICYFKIKDYLHTRQDAQTAKNMGLKIHPALLNAH
jgi:peptidoglycan/LPS O-acetylase OafA/YrhL/Flp pilus assembly protein TadD